MNQRMRGSYAMVNRAMAILYCLTWKVLRCFRLPMAYSRVGMAELDRSTFPTDRHARLGAVYFRLGSRLGEPMSMNNLGACYAKGVGVGRNVSQAVYWYRQSALKMCPAALHNLGYCLQEGEGVAVDKKKGYELTALAAAKGLPIAIYYQGLYKLRGMGCEKDEYIAFKCFHKAAWKGIANAQYDLALCYLRGEGTGRSKLRALFWLCLSALCGSPSARSALTNSGCLNVSL